MTNYEKSTKTAIRQKILKIRKSMSRTEILEASTKITDKILEMSVYESVADICCYMPVNNEVELDRLITRAFCDNKRVYLPRVTGDEMDFFRFYDGMPLIKGRYNIPEPDSNEILVPGRNTLIIMPGAVFSKEMDRIGYGGGYYDKYLFTHPEAHTLGICYDFQILDNIPRDDYDIRPQIIVSPSYTLEKFISK